MMNHKPVPGSDVLLAKVFDHDETSESTTAILLTATAQMITDCRTLVVLAHKHPEHACSLDAANLVSLPQPSSRTPRSPPPTPHPGGRLGVQELCAFEQKVEVAMTQLGIEDDRLHPAVQRHALELVARGRQVSIHLPL